MAEVGAGFWAAAARRLPSEFAAVDWFSSPLKRARETARLLADARSRKGEIKIVAELAEQDFGEFNGLSHGEVERRHPREYARLWRDPIAYVPPGGESFGDFYRRTADWWRRFREDNNGDCLLVAHSGTIRVIRAVAADSSPSEALSLVVPHLLPFLIPPEKVHP